MEPPDAGNNAKLPVVVIAGTSSGVGKTSISCGVLRALRERGLKVQAFKAGPDFIDPMHHAEATGRPSINLDTWMLSREQVLATFHRAAAGADVAVVEGVMGLFDGRDGATDAGSTAQLAKWLGAPVVLVLDASAVARSAAAVAKGYIEFDSQLRLGGIVFNKVGGAAHTQWLKDALGAAGIAAPVLGGIPKNDSVAVPERHLGLHMPGDATVPDGLVESLAQLVSTHVDLDALLELGRTAEVPPAAAEDEAAAGAAAGEPAGEPAAAAAGKEDAAAGGEAQGEAAAAAEEAQGEDVAAAGEAAAEAEEPAAGGEKALAPARLLAPAPPSGPPVRIAVAQDAAFCFYYNDNLALLREMGAELVPFSPLVDGLPADVAGVYLGGGYPERYAADLADNRPLRASLEAFARAGGVVYAECGGLLYLSKSIQPAEEEAPFPMVGVFPFRTVVRGAGSMRMGYVEVETLPGCPLFPPGRRVRGQVFHYSEIVQESVVGGLGAALSGRPNGGNGAAAAPPHWGTCYTVVPQIPGASPVSEGYCLQNVLASYVHLHFGGCPDFAASLVERCRGVDAAAVGAAAAVAAQTAAYLESAVASLQTSPQLLGKGGRPVPHCRSSPDFARDERLAAKHRGAAGGAADPHRHLSEDGLGAGRHTGGLLGAGGDPNGQYHLSRQGTLQPPAAAPPAANGIAAQHSLSPATTLSKVVSLNSLHSCSPQVGALPPGDALSPPLTDSPQQLSPRELEAQQQRELEAQQQALQHKLVGGGGGMPPLPASHHLQHHHLQQQQQQQQGYAHAYALGPQHQMAFANQQLAQQHHYANGHASAGLLDPSSPPHSYAGSMRAGAPGLAQGPPINSASWPRLHPGPQPLPPPHYAQQHGYSLASARGGGSAFAAAGPPLPLHHGQGGHGPVPGQHQHHYMGLPYYAANGAAGGAYGSGSGSSSRHSRNGSGCYDQPRPSSAGPAAMLVGRAPSPLDLGGMERLDPRAMSLPAAPYSWQHSHPPSDKIVSLSPGATEMLWALGLGARVAAVTDACDFPPDVVARAKARRSFAAGNAAASASYASLDRHPSLSSASGGNSAPASRRESPTVWQQRSGAAAWATASACGSAAGTQLADLVDEEVLARERPGLVVYEESAGDACGGAGGGGGMLCAGCGMGHAVLEALVAVGLQQSCRVVCVRRRTLGDVLDSMLVVGEAAGVRDEALCTVDRLRTRLRRTAGEAAAAAALAPSRPRVLLLQSLRPLRTVGWWAPDLVTLAGGTCWQDEQAGDAPQDLTWEQVQAFAPEVIVVAGMSNGSALRPLTDLCTVAALPGWWSLPAVRSSSVFVADSALFGRPGPRLVEGLECLGRMVWGEDGMPDCSCPERAVLKLSLRPGQRCRPRLLPNHFVPFT